MAATPPTIQPPTLRTSFVDASGALMLTSLQFLQKVYVAINLLLRPSASINPANNGELVVEATSNTTLTFKYMGDDGVVRSGTVTLS